MVALKLEVRVTDPETKNRRFVLVSSKKSDPQGWFYARQACGKQCKHHPLNTDRYDIACTEKIKLERRLKAEEIGATLNDAEPAVVRTPEPPSHRHRMVDVLESYVAAKSKPTDDEDDEPMSPKTIKAIRSEIGAFLDHSKITYLDEVTVEVLVAYRKWLKAEGYEKDTRHNKTAAVMTVLKNNKLCPTLLPGFKPPAKKITVPDPYSKSDFNAFMQHAEYEDALRIYAYISTGCRSQELMYAEKRNIDWQLGELRISKKDGFSGKTEAAIRSVPLPDDLLAELALRPEGLLFPALRGGVDWHFIRNVEAITEKAKILTTTQKPHMQAAGMVKDDPIHRFRDTYITNQLALHCKSGDDIFALCERVGHVDPKMLRKYRGRLKPAYEPSLPARLRKAKDRAVAAD